ncbi:MAG: NAD(P)/FAD-dependent oxidoreductase, partial [Steroidobacteraceae bacterium]
MRTHFDAIVIGAGPAGSTTAILLAQAGWSVALIEKGTFPRRKVCGECIAATNLPLLDALGVGAVFAAIAGPQLRRVALWAGTRSVTAALPAFESTLHPWGRALGREHLDDMLLQRAAGVGAVIFQPCTARCLGGGPGDFRCAIECSRPRSSMTLNAPVAIAAHGSPSASPRSGPLPRSRRPSTGLIAFKANFIGARLEPGLLPVLSFRGGYGGMVVAEQDRATLACCVGRERLRALRQNSPDAAAGVAVEAFLRRECAGVGAALDGATRVGAWLSTAPVQPGIRLTTAGGGAFLVGNAAGEAHPLIGEGIG